MKLLAVVTDTFREALARKTILGFFFISTFFLLVTLVVFLVARDSILSTSRMTGGVAIRIPPEEILGGVQTLIARALYAPAILLSIFATANIVPNAMEKGSIDLLLSKPLSRLEILTGKFLGGVLIVLLNVAYYLVGMWLIIAVTTGFWNAGLLWCILPVTYAFILLFSIAILLGVAARSSALAIILTYFLFILIIPVLTAREMVLFPFIRDATAQSVITALYYILPKTDDLANACGTLITTHTIDWMPVWTSGIFACAMLGGAVFLFRKKDF